MGVGKLRAGWLVAKTNKEDRKILGGGGGCLINRDREAVSGIIFNIFVQHISGFL